MARGLPVRLLFDVLEERIERREKEQLWRVYMTQSVSMWAKDAKPFRSIIDEYERMKDPSAASETESAYENADAVFAALEKARRGEV